MALLATQWDRLLIQNWKGSPEYINSLKKEEEIVEGFGQQKKEVPIPRNSIIFDPDQFLSYREFENSRAKFSKNRRVSIMKQRLLRQDNQMERIKIIPSIMPYALDIVSPEAQPKKKMYFFSWKY